MNATIEKSELVEALTRCNLVAPARATQPILQNVLLKAGRTITLQATDTARSITTKVDGKTTTPGELCLPAKELLERVKLLPEGEVGLNRVDTKVVLKTHGCPRRFSVSWIDGALFPTIEPRGEVQKTITTSTHTLANLLSATLHAVNTDTGRIQLNSVELTLAEEGLRATATDSHCVASFLSGDEPSGSKWLVPLASAIDLKRFCDTKADEEVVLRQSNQTLYVRFSSFEFSTVLAPGELPMNIDTVLNWPKKRSVLVERRALLEAMRAVSATCVKGGVALSFTANKLTLKSDSGEGFDEIAIDYDGDDITIGVEPRLISEPLSVLACEHVEIGSSDEFDPLVITVPGRDEFVAVAMPMRV